MISIWLCPDNDDELYIQNIINVLSDTHNCARFYPHCTLLSGVKEKESSEEAFDSSWQATFWTKESMMHQWECGGYDCDPDGFPLLYPYTRIHRQWKHKPDKYPTIDDAIKDGQTFYLNTEHGGKPDLLNMPIGQLFVNMKLVVEAFNETDPGKAGSLNVLDVYQKLVAKINEETGYTDFRLIKNPKVDGQWTLVDLNYLGQQDYLGKDWQDIKDEAQPDKKKSFKDLFEFDITSQSSIASGVKLGFKMPSDNLANMIAISGNSGGRGFSALDRLEDEAICTEIVHSLLEGEIIDKSSKVVDHFTRYLPEQGSSDMFLAKQA